MPLLVEGTIDARWGSGHSRRQLITLLRNCLIKKIEKEASGGLDAGAVARSALAILGRSGSGDLVFRVCTTDPSLEEMMERVAACPIIGRSGKPELRFRSARLRKPRFEELDRQGERLSKSRFRLITPMVFEREGAPWVFPDPTSVFGSLLESWNIWAPVQFPPTVRESFNRIRVERMKLSTEWAEMEVRTVTGCVGDIEYNLEGSFSPDERRIIAALTRFAPFCGLGAGVNWGLGAVETELVEFYRERDEAFERKVLETADRFEKEIRKTLDYLEPQVWKIAFELVGSEDMGTSYGSRTGIDEVDSIAEATLELLRFRSKLNSFRDEVGVYKYKRIGLDRLYKHDIEGEGRFSIFVSDSLHDFFRKNEDVVAVTVTYQRKGLDMQVPLELRQAVRNRIVRGGTVRFDSRFHWDHTLETAGGRLKLENPGTGEVVVVSRVFFPRLNMDSPNFDDYRDFTAVRDYETAVIDKDTGEVLDCVSWQLKWNISHFGSVAVEKGSSPVERADAREIKFLMQAGGETFPKVRRTDAAKERASSSTSKPGTRLPSKAPPPK